GFHVTGVQTCALPIYALDRGLCRARRRLPWPPRWLCRCPHRGKIGGDLPAPGDVPALSRPGDCVCSSLSVDVRHAARSSPRPLSSEERRVGKECTARM